MLTGAQIRAARGLLRWSAEQTAAKAGIARKTVERFEQSDGIPPSRSQSLEKLRAAFEGAGLEFLGSEKAGAGVRFSIKSPSAGEI